MEEPLPQIGGAKCHTWHEVTGELLNPVAQKREEERTLPPFVQVMPQPDVELPTAPSGRPPFRKIEGSLFLPEPVATDVQRQADEKDARVISPLHYKMRKHNLPTHRKHVNIFRLLGGGGGVPSPFIFREDEDDEPQTSPVGDDDLESRNSDEEATADAADIQQPIPFQMGVTPVGDEVETNDELQTWYEGTIEDHVPQARGSKDPVPKEITKPRPKPIIRERSARNLRNRQVARSIISQPKAKVHWNLQAQGRTYRKGMSPEQMKMEWDLHDLILFKFISTINKK